MKKFLSEQEYQEKLKDVKVLNESKKRKLLLKKEQNKYKPFHKLPSTSKLMAAYLFILLNTVLVYAMYAMWHFQDLQYLGVLITDVVGQILIYYIYAKKATIENSQKGITYELAMMEKRHKLQTQDDSEDDTSDDIAVG